MQPDVIIKLLNYYSVFKKEKCLPWHASDNHTKSVNIYL